MVSEKFVYVIGGVPGAGKTSMAGRLAKELGIDVVLSGDYLREFLRPYDHNGVISMSVYDARRKYGEMNKDNIIKGYIDQANYLSPGTNKILKRANRDGEKVILETLYFIPEMWEGIANDSVALAYLYVKNETTHREKLLHRTEFTHLRESGQRLADHLHEYRTIMDYTLNACADASVPIVETSNYMEAYDNLLKVMQD